MTGNYSADDKRKAITENYLKITDDIADAAKKSGRRPRDIALVGVTKTVCADDINIAIDAGLSVIGENKAQELMEKLPNLHPAEAHFIGNLQSNKVKYIIDKVALIQSVGSLSLMKEIDRQAKKHGITMDILLQINIGKEDSKGGFFEEELEAALSQAADYGNIRVRGLMAIPPVCQNPKDAQIYFTKMSNLFVDNSAKKSHNISMEILSMGMSADYREAILCGANTVRVGSLLFGKRFYQK